MARQIEGECRPLVILCAPRSYSSVVCAMIGQHPEMYGFPELNLFLTDTIGELLDLPPPAGYTAGLVRAIAKLVFSGANEATVRQAEDWMVRRRTTTTGDMFRFLSERIQPRVAVDKSPRTAMAGTSMRRALREFPHARFLHLTRHPVTTLRSLQEAHRRHARPEVADHATARFYAQLWVAIQRSILEFTAGLDPAQTLRIRSEDMNLGLDAWLANIADWLEIRSDPESVEAMKHPERSVYARPGPLGLTGDNDTNFMSDPRLRPIAYSADLTSLWPGHDAVHDEVVGFAELLGYQ